MYDRRCNSCGTVQLDLWENIYNTDPLCGLCGGQLERVFLPGTRAVIGDECDVWVKHGICNEDGSPRHYRSKAEMKRVADERKMINKVRHVGTKSGDRSKFTTKWY